MNTKRLVIFFGMISLFSGHSMAMNCPTSLSHSEMKTLRDEGRVEIDDKTYAPGYRSGDIIKKAIKSTVNPLRILEKNSLVNDDSYSTCTYTYGTKLKNAKEIRTNMFSGEHEKIDSTFTIKRIDEK